MIFITNIVLYITVYCVFSLESPHRGDSNEHTKYTIFNIQKKITLNYQNFFSGIFVTPALAGRHRRASFRPFVRSFVRPSVCPSIRQHLTWVSCERNSSYSFAPIVLKLCMCFPHGMRMCMWIGHNCWINFCHFFDIVDLVIFHPDYIDRGSFFTLII